MTSGRSGARPIDVMVAGAQKGGTTTLAALIERSPGVISHSSLEFPYFVDDDWFSLGYDAAFHRSFGPVASEGTVVAKSAGIMYVDEASARLAATCPDCRIVVVLRNPVERAYSAYWYLRRVGRETAPTFEDALDLERERLASAAPGAHLFAYRDRGHYLEQIQRLVGRFGPGRVQVWLFDDLVQDPGRVASGVASWAGLEPTDGSVVAAVGERNASAQPRSPTVTRLLYRPPTVLRTAVALLPVSTRNRWRLRAQRAVERGWSPPPMQPETRARLQDELGAASEALGRYLGRDLGHWL